jgi:hypothetical protein
LGIDSSRNVFDCGYNQNISGGYHPPEGVARLWRLCCKGEISIDPEGMVEMNIANIFRLANHSSGWLTATADLNRSE